MSEWIRTPGPGNPWHRAVTLWRHGPLDPDSSVATTCGDSLPVRLGLDEWAEELIGPDDQHPSCRTRAMREEHWQGQFEPGLIPDAAKPLVARAAPWLEDVELRMNPEVAGVGHAIRLRASNLDGEIWGGGRRFSDAAADLAATLEVMAP